MLYAASRFDPISALGCEIVLDRDQDHNDLDKCLLTVKDRNRDTIVGDSIGDLDVKVGVSQTDIRPNNRRAQSETGNPDVPLFPTITVPYFIFLMNITLCYMRV